MQNADVMCNNTYYGVDTTNCNACNTPQNSLYQYKHIYKGVETFV